jgi:uncharacterized protein (TIRG00374 family)
MKSGRVLQIVISLGLLGVLLRWIDGPAFLRAIAAADLRILALAFVLALADRLLMALKWNVLLRARDIRLTWLESIQVYWRSTFLGVFLPATVGGDVVRAILLSQRESRRAEVVSSILVERFLGLVSLALFGVLGAALAPAVLGGDAVDRVGLLVVTIGAALAVTVVFAYSFTGACQRVVESIAARTSGMRLVGKGTALLAKVYRSFRAYREHRGALATFFALSLFENLLPMARAFCVAKALHVDVGFLFFAAIVPLELLVIRLPVTIDGFGIREGLFMWFLVRMGVPESVGFAVGLVNHVLFLLAVVPGGVIHFLASKRAEREQPCAASRVS